MHKSAVLIVVLAAIALTSAQYFSSNDGINLPRNGKRSYLGYYFNMKEPTNQLFDMPEKYQQTDKLSFRKKFSKYGKRSGGGSVVDELEISDFDRYNQDADSNPSNLKMSKSMVDFLNNLEEKQQHNQEIFERK